MIDQEEFFKKKMQESIEKHNNMNAEEIENEEGYIDKWGRRLLTDEEKRRHQKEAAKRHYQKNKEKIRVQQKQYREEYTQRSGVKIRQVEANKRYLANNPQALAKSRRATREYYAEHRRNMKSIEIIPNAFPEDIDVEYHHLINDYYAKDKHCWFVIPLPKITHNYIAGGTKGKHHWKHNARWIKKIYGMDVKQFLLDS